MTKQILLYEPKTAEGELLAEHIEALGDVQVIRARTMREACGVLTTRPCDLALLPVTRNDSLVYSLRMLQPNLPMYLLLEQADEFVPERQAQVVHGQMVQTDLLAALPSLLGLQEKPTAVEKIAPRPDHAPQLDRHQLTMLVQNAMLDARILVVVVTDGDEVIGFRHAVHQGQIEAIAQLLRRTWPAGGTLTTQIQYLPPKAEEDTAVLLYSRPLWGNYLLTIGAVPHMPLAQLRQQADRLTHALAQKEQPLSPKNNRPITPAIPLTKSHAFLLKPQEPLNGEVLLALQGVLPTLGLDYGLEVHHVIVQPTFVHFMTSGSPQHTIAWLAQYFKTAIMESLETHFDLPWPFWTVGYYAEERDSPLDPSELTFFAQSQV